ncbi:DUF2922 domain-containing protein [Cytobacillus sp. S13-E01]|uniref:DUF2922 domain-containing protein n=1 Tax=Cytobacillus sp. S13-E01 TaxID=3031326 RepID=UPI0023D82BA6|nr:DUF2922 domain-containing protein [Cytobacillus sp. S13-E01]MDF0728688.1 DUF2922 domain-containing protein [Cytobacillus sp. S13-E01]
MAKVLEMQFTNLVGKLAKITIENPIEPIDAAAVSAAMDTIVANDVFTSSGGGFVAKHSARVVERNVSDVELA